MSASDLLAVTLRALSFIAALQAAGVPLFQAFLANELEAPARAVARLGGGAAVCGLLLTVAYQLVESARMAGDLSGVFDRVLSATAVMTALFSPGD